MNKQQFLLSVIVLSMGCAAVPPAPPFDWGNVELIKSRITSTRDAYKKTDYVRGPAYKVGQIYYQMDDLSFLLRAFRTDRGRWVSQVYVTHRYRYTDYPNAHARREVNRYNDAYDSDGIRLDFNYVDWDIEIERRTLNSIATEEFALTLPDGYLEEHKFRDLDIKVSGKYWSSICQIPQAYVQAFLQKLSELEIAAP